MSEKKMQCVRNLPTLTLRSKEILWHLLKELVVIITLSIFIGYFVMQFKSDNMGSKIIKTVYTMPSFRAGDILIFIDTTLYPFFPGHMCLIVETPAFGQLGLFEINVVNIPMNGFVKPLRYVLRIYTRSKKSRIVYLRMGGPGLDQIKMWKILNKFGDCKFSRLSHFKFVSHRLQDIVGIPNVWKMSKTEITHTGKIKRFFYCSEIVFDILVHYGVFRSGVVEKIKIINKKSVNLIGPDIGTKVDLNQFTVDPYTYNEPIELQLFGRK